MYCYLVRNVVNGKGYVGITSRGLAVRLREHYRNKRHDGEHALYRAIKKYGRDAFTITLLGEATGLEELQAMERTAIQHYNTYASTGHGYNLTLGGEGTPGFVSPAVLLPKTSTHRARLSASRKAFFSEDPDAERLRARLSEGARAQSARQGNPMQGRKHSPEALAKMAAKKRGKSPSEATKARISFSLKGRPSPTKGKPSPFKGKPGRIPSAETRAKLSAARTGSRNHKARPVEVDGVAYPSIMDAVRQTAYSAMQVKYQLKKGRARYLDIGIT